MYLILGTSIIAIIANVSVECMIPFPSTSMHVITFNGSRLSQVAHVDRRRRCNRSAPHRDGEGVSEVVHVLTNDIQYVLSIHLNEFLEIDVDIFIGVHLLDHVLELLLRNVQETELTHDAVHLSERYPPISILVQRVEYIFKFLNL